MSTLSRADQIRKEELSHPLCGKRVVFEYAVFESKKIDGKKYSLPHLVGYQRKQGILIAVSKNEETAEVAMGAKTVYLPMNKLTFLN